MASDDRLRQRRGPVRIVGGVPYSSRETTLSLLPGASTGEWLHDHRHLIGGRLLDAGCGNQPLAEWYRPLVDEAVGLDAAPHPGVVVGRLEEIPFPDASFDTVLCTDVLEHVDDAERSVSELFRVTRPGGHLLLSVPFLYPTHEAPYDRWRFTRFGLRVLLERHGFDVLALGAAGGAARLLSHWGVLALTAAAGPLARRRAVRAAIAAPQEALIRLRRTPRSLNGSAGIASLGYVVVARRPPGR